MALVVTACGEAEETTPETDAAEGGSEQSDPQESEGQEGDAEESEEEPEAVLSVVATVAPITDLVAQVGGSRVEVASLVPAGGDAHTYEPRPQDVVTLSEADAYFGIGLGLNDGALRLAEENLEDDAPIYLLGEAALADADLVFDHTHDDEDADHTHDDEDADHTHDDEDADHTHDDEDADHSHDDEEDSGHSHDDEEADHSDDEETDDPGPNPHVWTSVRNAAALADEVTDALSELDPDGAESYTNNAAEYRQQLADLDRTIDQATETIPEDNRTLLSYHDAWTYFARDYDLDYATAVQPADFSEPSAAEVRAVIDLIRELDVSVVFGSEVFPTPVLETIADETGATYVSDLSDDVLPGEPGTSDHSYLELMRRNAHAIIDALGGDASELS